MKNQIASLVGQNKLREAIALLPMHESIMLGGRLSALEKQERMGTISYSDATRMTNQIAHAILSFAGIDSDSITPKSVQQQPQTSMEGELQTIIIQNKRRREEIANEARMILSNLQAYNNEKALIPGFDPVNRRYRVIEESFIALKEKLNEAKGDSIEAIIDRIKALIAETIPSYDKLNEAYRLASGRGMKSEYVDRTLNSRPDDNEARINVATEIELFISKISVVWKTLFENSGFTRLN